MEAFDRSGRRLILSPPVRSGGEGSIHEINGRKDVLAKIYHPGRVGEELRRKLEVMLRNPPEDPTWSVRKHRSIAWVQDLLYASAGRSHLVGFVMPAVDRDLFKESHTYFDTRDRIRRFGGAFTWKHLLIGAANIASAVQALHESGHRVGDLRDTNILVSPNSLIVLIDCDSMQIRDPGGKVFPTRVGTSEFLPPEMQRAEFRTSAPDRYASDLFALGVIVFKMLMLGVHPFQARGPGVRELHSTEAKIEAGTYPYERRRGLSPPEFSPPIELLSPALRALAEACFVRGHKKPGARPSAADWQRELLQDLSKLKVCKSNSHHVFGGHLRTCPWCRFAGKNPDPFPQSLNPGGQLSTAMANAASAIDGRRKRLASHVATALSDGPLSEAERGHLSRLAAELGLTAKEAKAVVKEEERKAPRLPFPQANARTVASGAPKGATALVSTRPTVRSVEELKRLLNDRMRPGSRKQTLLSGLAWGCLGSLVVAAALAFPVSTPLAVVFLMLPALAVAGDPGRDSIRWALFVPKFLQSGVESLYYLVPAIWWSALPAAAVAVGLRFAGIGLEPFARGISAGFSVGWLCWMIFRKADGKEFLTSINRGAGALRSAVVMQGAHRIPLIYPLAVVALASVYLALRAGPLWWPLPSMPLG